MSLVSKIFVALIFLAALPFSYMAARTLKTHQNWRSLHESLEEKIDAEKARQIALANGIVAIEDAAEEDGEAKEVIEEAGIRQLEAQLDRARLLRGRVWRRCVVDQAEENGRVTLTIEFPRPHTIRLSDVGKLVLYAFDLTVWEVGEGDDIGEDIDEPIDEPDDEPIDEPDDEPVPDEGDVPVEGEAPADGDAPADGAAPAVDDQAGLFSIGDQGALCQDEPADPMDEADGEGDAEAGEAGEGEGEEGEGEEVEEEEEEVEEEAPDDSQYEYEIKNYMGQFRLTAVVGNQITLELMEHASPLKLQQIKDNQGPWILFDTMPIDDPDAYDAWDEDTLKDKLPGDVPDELAKRGEEIKDGETAQYEWVEVKFTRPHSMDLTAMVEQVEAALAEDAEKLLRAELEALGKTPDEIDALLEKYDFRVQGLKPILDPEMELEPEGGEEGEEDGAAPRPGVPRPRPKARVKPKKPQPLRVRFDPGDIAVFDRVTAKKLTTERMVMNDEGQEENVKPVAEVVRRIRRWHLRDYARYFNFISARISELVDQIARSNHDRDRLVIRDATGTMIGGSLHLLALRSAAKITYYNKLKADTAQFEYELAAVKRYEALVEAQLTATLAHREALRGQVGTLAKKLARVKQEQLGRIQVQPASAKKP